MTIRQISHRNTASASRRLLRPHNYVVSPRRLKLAQSFVTELLDSFEVIPVVTGCELIISRLVFTRPVLITARQEDRGEQAYDGEQTRVAWTFASDSSRRFVHVHDPHSLKSFEARL